MSQTTSMTLIAIGASTAFVGNRPRFIQAKPLGADGLYSGSPVRLSSSDTKIGTVTSAEQIGNAPVGVVGQSAGSVTITATAADNMAVTATLVITVS
jgi:hypothetical protein